ncbi:2-polyprenyl-3-methyl-6-methoxy-1,4-benzoquinone monooxygenase [Piscinibacter sp. HJYY11]|uniref:2-polyprenyl-3-methyl-6-methoxy-1,4-benzoquinone monooxygenase n=1 Tax=Piscinibacter sp. HJYY11 TaxID=2801333 RepID=UPI00191D8757|nr:2-polyprenyl-3-methyl-6-methoxy-1,4-benzoquinone monooxygenase [Piscinibacter sp. HJYY11]MBL0728098.1 2-polyprenyl-3-methyl-6-methoxy-1,4-benzoquinone monooxygenase [Piscinibacter sp. HJYY11]
MTRAPTARTTSVIDDWINAADNALRTLSGAHTAARPTPAHKENPEPLSTEESRLSASLMRVNHVGEICAQALYNAQLVATRNPALREKFRHAAREETDHLAWTQQRLRDLNARPSLLNPLWYAGAFGIGLVAGRIGDGTSLGFVVETEAQVEQHLASHLDRLPASDSASRAIVEQMKIDEAQHGAQAQQAGAAELPAPVRWAMRAAAKVMTTTAHYV